MVEKTLSFILREIGSVLDGLAELAQRKSQAIVTGDMPGLDEVVRSEQGLSHRLAVLEEERAIAAASAPAQEAGEIEELRSSLREKAEILKSMNQRNQQLLRQGLDVVEFGLKVFMPTTSYKGAPKPGPVLFDHRV